MAGFRLHRRRKIISLPCKALTRSLYRLSHDQWLVFVPPSIFTLGSQPRRQLLQDAQNETSAGGAPAPAPGVKPGELPCPCEAGPPGSEAGSGVSSGGHACALISEVPLPPPPPPLWDGRSRKFRECRSRGSSACQSQKSANKGTRTS